MNNDYFVNLRRSRQQALLQNYFTILDPNIIAPFNPNEKESIFFAFQELRIIIPEPKVSLWEFLPKEEVQELLKCRKSHEIRKYLDAMKLTRICPKGRSKTVFLDLMHSVTKFCKQHDYSVEKSGALMSQFYLTHILVTTSYDKSTEKVYTYFKELALGHTLPDFPPKNAKIFSQEETKRNMMYFCQIYLRNLPLIRFICLPNFAFYLRFPAYKQKGDKKSSEKKKKKKK